MIDILAIIEAEDPQYAAVQSLIGRIEPDVREIAKPRGKGYQLSNAGVDGLAARIGFMQQQQPLMPKIAQQALRESGAAGCIMHKDHVVNS
ncbi:MAG: hypothetical protein E7K92_25610, partial [Serratia marcescens]|nr:hypothetical protein [Serratia marcescens]